MARGVMTQTKRGVGLMEASVLLTAFCLPTTNPDIFSVEQGSDGSGRLEGGTRPGLSSPDLLDGGIREVRSAVVGLQILP